MDRLTEICDVVTEARALLDSPADDPRRAVFRAHVDEVLEQIEQTD